MPEPQRKRLDKWTRRLIWLFGIAVTLLLLFGGYHWALRARIAGQLDAIRAAGDPATLDDVAAMYTSLPAGEDAGPKYRQALSDFDRPAAAIEPYVPFFDGSSPALGQPYPQKMLAAMRQYVATNKEALALFAEAGRMRHGRFLQTIATTLEDALTGAVSGLSDRWATRWRSSRCCTTTIRRSSAGT